MLTNEPQDVTATEGGDVTYNCTALQGGSENGTPLLIAWRFTPSGSSGPVTLITGTNLTGIEMVTVSNGLRTMLTFSGVQREANGGRVVCIAIGSSAAITSELAALIIRCELLVYTSVHTTEQFYLSDILYLVANI